MIDYENESNEVRQGELSRLSELCVELQKAKDGVSFAEEALKVSKEKQRKLEEEEIPSLMAEVGLSEVKLEDGTKVTVSEEVRASIPKAKIAAAMGWLRDNGFEDIIKNQITVKLNAGDDEKARTILQTLEDFGVIGELKEAVHPSTLKAFVKEQDAAGVEMPEKDFGIYRYQKTQLK